MSKAERDRIFERLHRAMDDGIEVCGLGLSIVREVAERHGGDVCLAETAEGARFELKLPHRGSF